MIVEGLGIDPEDVMTRTGPSVKKALALLEEQGEVESRKYMPHQQRYRKRNRNGRKCGGLNVFGEPCGAPPLKKGTVVDGVEASGDFCLRHDGDLPETAWKRFTQEGNRVAAEKRRQPRPLELLAETINKSPHVVFDPFFRTLGYEWDDEELALVPSDKGGAKIVGFSREGVARLSKHDDLAAMREAAKELQNRLWGKPRLAMELAGGGAAAAVVVPNNPERNNAVAKVLVECGAVEPTPIDPDDQ